MAPISKVLARSQTGLEKSGANSTIRGNSSAGNVSIRRTPFGEEIFRSLCGLPLLFQRSELDKVELRRKQRSYHSNSRFGNSAWSGFCRLNSLQVLPPNRMRRSGKIIETENCR